MSAPSERQMGFQLDSRENGQVLTIGNDVRFALAVKDALAAHFPCSYWSTTPIILATLPLPATSADLAEFARTLKKNHL